MIGAAMTQGNIFVENAISEHLKPLISKLKEVGAEVEEEIDGIRVIGHAPLRPADIKTLPYPGFPTDMQAQFMALTTLCQARVSSRKRSLKTASCTSMNLNGWVLKSALKDEAPS